MLEYPYTYFMSKFSMEQPASKDELKRRKITKLKNTSIAVFNKTYLKTKEEGIPVKINKAQFLAGLISKEGCSKQEANILIAELIREKIISIKKKERDIELQEFVEAIVYYPPQEIIEGKKDKPAELSEAELNDILHAKPIPSFSDILICKNCNCMTHDKKDFPNICAKCGKDRKGEIVK